MAQQIFKSELFELYVDDELEEMHRIDGPAFVDLSTGEESYYLYGYKLEKDNYLMINQACEVMPQSMAAEMVKEYGKTDLKTETFPYYFLFAMLDNKEN